MEESRDGVGTHGLQPHCPSPCASQVGAAAPLTLIHVVFLLFFTSVWMKPSWELGQAAPASDGAIRSSDFSVPWSFHRWERKQGGFSVWCLLWVLGPVACSDIRWGEKDMAPQLDASVTLTSCLQLLYKGPQSPTGQQSISQPCSPGSSQGFGNLVCSMGRGLCLWPLLLYPITGPDK